MAFIPRRSPRLSKVDPETPPRLSKVDPETPPRRSPRLTKINPATSDTPLRTKEQSHEIVQIFSGRIVMDPEDRQNVVSTIKQYLDRIETIKKNRTKKARIVITLCEYLIQQPFMLASHPHFTSTLERKMLELQKEHIRNLEVCQAFQKAVADLLFVVS